MARARASSQTYLWTNLARRERESRETDPTLDIAHAEGQQVVRELAAVSDVLIENYKAGGLAKYGLGYEDLKAINPGLVYCSVTGFGQSGPRAAQPGYDFLVQGIGGLMSVTGEAEGAPMKVGVALTDVMTGLYTAIAALAALHRRAATGAGAWVDMALLDVTVATLANQATSFLTSGQVPRRLGNAHPSIFPYDAFATADDHIIVAVGNDAQFAKLAAALGKPELAAADRFATNAARVEGRAELGAVLREALRARPAAEWIEALGAAGVPCGPINSVAQVFDEPQVAARGMAASLPHPTAAGGAVPQVACPIRFSGEERAAVGAPPTLGQHTESVLREVLGMDDARIGELRRGGALGAS